MSDLSKTIIVLAVCFAVVALGMWKLTFWSGTFPPNRGWSDRQLRRMDQGKSPWTLWCAIKYRSDKRRI